MNSSPRVSLIVYSLNANPIVRATPIAQALARLGFDVEVTGVLRSGLSIYKPYANTFDYVTAPSIRELSKQISGDIIYACKPFPETLLTAMIASGWGRTKPVLLDVEDDDYGVVGRTPVVRCLRAARDFAFRPKGYLYGLTNRMRTRCDAVTVSTSALQNYFGGTKILHGPNETEFDPTRTDLNRNDCRARLDCPKTSYWSCSPVGRGNTRELLRSLRHHRLSVATWCLPVIPTNRCSNKPRRDLGTSAI